MSILSEYFLSSDAVTPQGRDESIPYAPGLPLIGNTLAFMQDPLKIAEKLYLEHGEIVRTRLTMPTICFFGPEANEFILMDREKNFSSYDGWKFFIDQVFPNNVMAMDGDAHKLQRKLMSVAFKKPALVDYLQRMNPAITEGIETFNQSQAQKVFPQVKKLTLDLATKVFMGMEVGPEADQVNNSFLTTVEAALAIIRKPVRPFNMWKGVQGREFLVNYFAERIPEKRASQTPDFFSQFCHAETEEGEKFTDQQIIDHMIFLMMAAHDTTTSALTTMFYTLGKDIEWQNRLREASQALQKEHLEFSDLDQLEELGWVMKEALRLYPPLTSMPRGVAKDCEYKGYKIRKGELVSVSPILTHHLPEIWSNPYQFDPERFSTQRAEHKKHWYAYIPFGGGHHMCLGQHFADLQVKTVMHQMLLNYSWSVDDNYVMPYQLVPIAKPKDGLPMTFKKL